MAERDDIVDLARIGSNLATETVQPHFGQELKEMATETWGHHGPFSTITRGPNGFGASYAMMEPVGRNWHEVKGAIPLVQRATGA